MQTQYPEVIITGRGAVVYNMKRTFIGGSMVYTFSSNGKRDYLMVKKQKWRVRAFFGIRL
jgi:hypothetical protein